MKMMVVVVVMMWWCDDDGDDGDDDEDDYDDDNDDDYDDDVMMMWWWCDDDDVCDYIYNDDNAVNDNKCFGAIFSGHISVFPHVFYNVYFSVPVPMHHPENVWGIHHTKDIYRRIRPKQKTPNKNVITLYEFCGVQSHDVCRHMVKGFS